MKIKASLLPNKNWPNFLYNDINDYKPFPFHLPQTKSFSSFSRESYFIKRNRKHFSVLAWRDINTRRVRDNILKSFAYPQLSLRFA